MTSLRIVANLAGQGWNTLVYFAATPVLVAMLGDSAYGVVAFYLALQIWMTLLEGGIGTSVMHKAALCGAGAPASQGVGVVCSAYQLTLLLAFAIALVGMLIAPGLAGYWICIPQSMESDAEFGLRISAVCISLRIIESFHRSFLMGAGRQIAANAGYAFCTTSRAVLPIAGMYAMGAGLRTFFVGLLVASAIGSCTMAMLSRVGPISLVLARPSLHVALPLLRQSRGVFVYSLACAAISQADKIVASKFSSVAAFAHYSLASQLASVISLLCGPLSISLLPNLARQRAAGNVVWAASRVRAGFQACAVISGACACALLLHGAPVLQAWLRRPDLAEEVGRYLVPLGIGAALNCVTVMPYTCAVAAGKFSALARYHVALALVALPLIVTAGWLLTPVGLAWTCAGVSFVHSVAAARYLVGDLRPGPGISWLGTDVLVPWIACFAAALVLAALHSWGLLRLEGLVRTCIAGLAAAAAGLSAAPQLRHLALLPLSRLRESD